jgi:hypothetical protein
MSIRKEAIGCGTENSHVAPNVCHAAIGSENFVARTVQTGPPAPSTRTKLSPKKLTDPWAL